MVGSVFPYGNDLQDPDSWAYKRNNLSKEWYICYHSGYALGCGMHTLLFFGTENLTAAVVNFIGCGRDIKFGIEKGSSLVSASDGASKFLGKAEDFNEAYSFKKSQSEIPKLESAKEIYDVVAKNGQTCNAMIPFSVDDLMSKSADMAGADINLVIAAANYYEVMAIPLFSGWHARNVSKEFTSVSAGIGVSKGFLFPVSGKIFSLWAELAHSTEEEYPFRSYNVHPVFRNWKSSSYANSENARRYDKQNKMLGDVGDDMVENYEKYGFDNAQQARDAYLERRKKYDNSNRDPAALNKFMPWIDQKNQHLFYE